MTREAKAIRTVALNFATVCGIAITFPFGLESAQGGDRSHDASSKAAHRIEAPAEASAHLSEVVVTAEKVPEKEIHVPISMSVYTQDQMDKLGIQDLQDIVEMTPGVEYSDDRGASQRIVIRGVYSQAGASTSSIYIDDVPVDTVTGILNLIGVTSPLIFDLDRVEVLRGPQGTLFGAGAEGGAIRFITPDPSLTAFSGYTREDLETTAGGDPSYEAGIALGGPIVDGKLGYRVSAYDTYSGGYIDHNSVVPGGVNQSNANWSNGDAFRGALKFVPIPGLTITPAIFYQKVKMNDSGFFDPSLSNVSQNRFVNGNALLTPIDDEFYLPSLKVEADLGPVSVTSISSYIHRNDAYTLDYTNVFASIFGLTTAPSISDESAVAYGNVQDIVTQEIHFQSTDPNARLTWVAGTYFESAHQQVTENIYSPGFPQMSQQYFGLSVADAFGAPMIGNYSFLATDVNRWRQLAGFAQLNYRLAEKVTLVAGARYSELHTDFNFNAAGPIEGGAAGSQGGQDGNAVTPKFGINYQVNPNDLLYANAAKGYRIGGANPPLETTPACTAQLREITGGQGTPDTYNPDSLWSYEIGSKNSMFGGRALLEASAFYTDWKNIQQSIYVPACLSSFVANVGKATIDGFDLTVNTALTERFHVGLNIGYTNAKVAQTTGVPGTNVIYAYKGDQLDIFSSPWTYVAMVEYTFPAFGRASFARVDDEYHPKNPGPFTSLSHPGPLYSTLYQPNPATNLLNMRMGTYLGSWELSAYVKNALNTHPFLYDLSALGIGGSALGDSFTFRPRTIGIESIYKW